MKHFNLRAAIESRPIEDQDLEDTATPSKDAGQIDGDTTELSGQSKPGQQPVPDSEDTTHKVDAVPQDLSEVLIAQDKEAGHQVETLDHNAHTGVTEQNVATEGIFENIKDHFTHNEKEWHEDKTSAQDNLERIEAIREKLVTRKGDVHPGTEKIHLSKYAKWLGKDKKLVTNPTELIKELERLDKFSSWILDSYQPNVRTVFKHLSEDVLKKGETDLEAGYENLKKTLDLWKPKGMESVLSEKRIVKITSGATREQLYAPFYLGHWTLCATTQGEKMTVQGKFLEFDINFDRTHKIPKGDFDPLNKAEIDKILTIIDRISKRLAGTTPYGEEANRFVHALDEFAYRYRYFNELSGKEKDMVRAIYGFSESVAGCENVFHAYDAINHTVRVLCLYIEKSLRRVK